MKAVIMAAGKGTRLKDLTRDKPKALVEAAGRPIIEYTFDSLPDQIDEVIIVVGYLGHKIREYIGEFYRGRKITYVEQGELNGTGGALLVCQDLLKDEARFLVMNGDDIYAREEIAQCLVGEWTFGYARSLPIAPTSLSITIDNDARITGSAFASALPASEYFRIPVGIYGLSPSIFDCEFVAIDKGELGLPHTILAVADNIPVRAVEMSHWFPMNTQEEIQKYEHSISQRS